MTRRIRVPEQPAPAEPVSPPESAPREGLLRFADALASQTPEAGTAAPERELHLVVFSLDREEFAVPIAKVREIVRVSEITRVPQSPPHIRGVMNLRGRILPVVEIRTRLHLAPATVTTRSRVVIVEAHGRTLGILVDAVSHVVKLPESATSAPPEEVLAASADYVIGVARQGTRLLLLLDLDRALLLESAIPSTAKAAS